MSLGARDDAMNGKLERLVPAIERELKEVENRRARKLAEGELSERVERLKSCFNFGLIGMAITSRDKKMVEVNDQACEILGYPREELLRKKWSDLTHPDDLAADVAQFDRMIAGEIDRYCGDKRFIRKDGETVYTAISIECVRRADGAINHFAGLIQDITERKQAEKKLNESEYFLGKVQAMAKLGIYALDVATGLWTSSSTLNGIFGINESYPKTFDGWLELIVPEQRKELQEYLTQHVLVRRNRFEREYLIVRQNDRKERWVLGMGELEFDQTGDPIRMIGTIQDITERKQAERERKVIHEIIQGIVATPNLDEFLNLIHRSISQIVYAENCFVMLGDIASEMAHFEFWVDKYDPCPAPRPLDKGFSGYVFRTGKALLLNEKLKKRMYKSGVVEQIGSSSASWLGVPLRTHSQTIGVLVLQHYEDKHAYNERDLAFLSSVGDQIALAIERKRAEEAISTLRRELELTMSSMEEGVHRVDLNGIIVFENPAAARMLGWEINQLLGRPAHLTMHHTKSDGTPYTIDECPIYATFRDGVSRHVADEVFWRKDGTSFPVEYTTAPIRNDQNEIVSSVVNFRDVTERKRVKDALKLFRALVDQSNDTIEVLDPETGRFLDINEKGHLALGYSREEYLALSVFDLDPTVSQAAFPRIVEDLRKSGAMTWEGIRKRKDGSTFPVEVNLKYVPLDRDYVVAVVRDITERKGAEEQLRLHATALEAAANAIVITNRDGTIVWVNPAFTEFTGYTLEEAAGQKPSIIRSGEHDAAYYKTLWDTILAGQPWRGEMINRRKDGTTYFEEQTITPVMDETGEITNFIAIKQDVTERKQAEEALSESQERYHDLIENSLDIIYTHDLDGNYTSANKAVEDILGYTIEEAVTKNFATTVVPEDIEKATQMSSDLLAGKEAPVTELDVFAKDGHRVSLEINAKLIQENGVPVGIQGVARDVTERKHLEEQLRQSQKLESIGRLAGGIAHDFNNMLTAINGYSELALRRLTSEDPIRPNIEEIKKAGERSALLTNQLLAFSRRQILRPETIHINDNINDTTNMLQRLIGEDIELEIALEPNVGSIKFDPGQLSQIIMNLAVNARDAMPDGGKLTIETANVFLDPEYASGHVGVLPGAYVMLSVADNGTGMPPEVQEQIFEPFFTTKEVGKGTGLGLATVYGIVKQSGGNIRVYSEVRGGTTFKIYIPRVIAEDEIIETREPSIKLALGGETILLAEDESTVRSLSRKVLEACGYSVIEAANGIEALEIFKFSTADIDLLFTDVVMPGMGGRELAEKLLEINPNLPVLFSSGYTDDAIVMHGVLDANVNFIQKPFTLDNLARIVRDLLDAAEIARKHGK